MSVLRCLCLVLGLLAPSLASAAVLENPSPDSFYSGIGVISGWKCEANGPLTVRFNGGEAIPLAYRNERPDTASVCNDTNNGFVAIWNWARLGDGVHVAVVYDNGLEFGRSTFEVATLGVAFERGAVGECRIDDFPSLGESTLFEWNEATQHLELVRENRATTAPPPRDLVQRERATRDAKLISLPYDSMEHLEPETVNWYKVSVPWSGRLLISTMNLPSPLGCIDHTSPDDCLPANGLRHFHDISNGAIRIVRRGGYYIGIRSEQLATQTQFVLRVEWTGLWGEDVHAGSFAGATLINLDTPIMGEMHEEDTDFFKVIIPEPGTLELLAEPSTDRESIDGQIRSIVYDEDRNEIVNHITPSNRRTRVHLTREVGPGTYYISLHLETVGRGGPYTITVSVRRRPSPPPPPPRPRRTRLLRHPHRSRSWISVSQMDATMAKI